MHSSRMCTARSSSRPRGGGGSASMHAGIQPPRPRCGSGDPPCCKACWACNACWDTTPSPPLWTDQGSHFSGLTKFLTFPAYTFYSIHTPPSQVWAWRPPAARHAGIPLQCMLGYHPPCGQTKVPTFLD